MGKSWLFASGKGGVGKSTLVSCLGLALAAMDRKVCIIDADIGLRDQDLIMGLEDSIVYDILDVIEKRCALEQALIQSRTDRWLFLLPAAQFARSSDLKKEAFARLIGTLKESFDDVLIDCPAGVERGLRGLLHTRQDHALIICTPDDVCIRNADRTAIIMKAKDQPRPELIVNRLDDDLVRCGEMYSAVTVAQTLDLELLGEVPDDIDAYRAALSHRSPMHVDCELADAVNRIARRMTGESIPFPCIGKSPLPWYLRLFRRKPDRLIDKGGPND